jgi:Protein of unknown function (DUF2612)
MKNIEQLIPYINLEKYMFLQYSQSYEEIDENGESRTVKRSPNMYKLLNNYVDWINKNIVDHERYMLNNVQNINNIDEFGATVWSNILGFNPDIYVNQIPLHSNFFGVDGKGLAFDQSHFQSEFDSGLALSLTIKERIKMLQLRYLSVMWDGSMEMLNNGLKVIFENIGKIIAIDHLDMTMSYRFYFSPSGCQLTNLFNSDFADGFWPRPACVKVSFEDFSVPYLAFDNKELAKFDETKLIN